jgi:surfeit locus 1 family protein
MRAKGLVGMTALTACVLALLVGLGVWQLKRLAWKEGLIAQIEARSTAAPITLKAAVAAARNGDASYLRVRVQGRFLNDKERYLYTLSDGAPGWEVITPLATADGDLVLVDRGFVPDALRDPASRPQGQTEGVVAVTGLVRAPETPETKGTFTPDNDPARNHWFWRDLTGMVGSMFPEGATGAAPFFLAAERNDIPGGWPQGGQTRLALANNHLQYAITWFALAFCIVVIYAFYVRSRLREGTP